MPQLWSGVLWIGISIYIGHVIPEGKYLSVFMYSFPTAVSFKSRFFTLAFPSIVPVLNISKKDNHIIYEKLVLKNTALS